MPAAGASTFDGNAFAMPAITFPYRAAAPDFNGIALTDSQVNPPDPATMPTANLLNSWSAEIVALRRLIQSATISVRYVAGAPVIDSFTAGPTAFVQQVPTAAFTVARTGGGAASGDISITWPANSLPSFVTQPGGNLNGLVPGMIAISQITNGVRVVTLNAAGAATDIPFTADVC